MTGGNSANGSLKVALAGAIVGLLHDYTGRGPKEARAYVADDLVTVVLRDTLTRAEVSLVDGGEGDFVLSLRRKLQATMGDDMIAAVEDVTERPVIAFMSDSTLEPDVSAEIFMLAAQAGSDDQD